MSEPATSELHRQDRPALFRAAGSVSAILIWFGLLQKHLAEYLPTWAVLVVSALVFWAGHVLLLPERFAPIHLVPSLAILALGFVLASLRIWLGALHIILALHLAFYFIFA